MVRHSRSRSPSGSSAGSGPLVTDSLPKLDPGTLQELGALAPALQRAVGVGDAARSAELLETMSGMLPREAAVEGATPVAIPRRWIPGIVERLQVELRTDAAAPTVGRQIQLLSLAFPPHAFVRPYQRLLAAVVDQTGFGSQGAARCLDEALITIRSYVDHLGRAEFPQLVLSVAPGCPRESRGELVPQNPASPGQEEGGKGGRVERDAHTMEPILPALLQAIRSRGASAAQSVSVAHAIIQELCASVLRRERVIIPSLGELVRTSGRRTSQLQATLDTSKLWPGRSIPA